MISVRRASLLLLLVFLVNLLPATPGIAPFAGTTQAAVAAPRHRPQPHGGSTSDRVRRSTTAGGTTPRRTASRAASVAQGMECAAAARPGEHRLSCKTLWHIRTKEYRV